MGTISRQEQSSRGGVGDHNYGKGAENDAPKGSQFHFIDTRFTVSLVFSA
jgi:hypothetical protein